MVARGRVKPGRYKVRDDESGFVWWNDQVTEQWDGQIVKRGNQEIDHPQKYIAPGDDPTLAEIVRPDIYPDVDGLVAFTTAGRYETLATTNPYLVVGSSGTLFDDYVLENVQPDNIIGLSAEVCPLTGVTVSGTPLIPQKIGPASHLFKAGIGTMVIEDGHEFIRFTVR